MSLVLAVEIDGDGAHPEAWRRAAHPPAALLGPRRVRHVAEIAERAGFTLVTLDDDLLPPDGGIAGRIGAVERAAFIAASTSVLSVAPVVSTTYTEPFHVSSQLASVDHISAGRAGWVVATSPRPGAAEAWGRPVADPRQEAADAVRVVRALWDSWEDDAVVRDVATGRYLDRDRLHYVDFTGATYTVTGPAIVPRPPQGQLVVLAPPGLVPDEEVDVTLVGGADVAAVRQAAAATTTPRTFAEIEVALDTSAADGADRVAALDRHAPWPVAGRLRYTGGPGGLVALLRDLDAQAGVDGVRLHPLVLDEDLAVLSQYVVPALIKSRLAARPLPGASLRQTLGLPRPQNRFALPGGPA
ncbi:LLM class flavin-dependent oxidoreductase [Dactylosporangium fulvum]|uniref:LLM class flavin-dependent oxidoreductase n=1 Tax=Dactylosporangium fulvum TaxID=53359 RepID=A0ABY5W6X7_9ACTN|nr:LLM class flavin-dependent oxidoreductase [Dactylosporangium fulvum]UWP85209.1 LLM class flavin-dependent oxidoreductase [Dactylosporangium fulvum]